MPSFLSPSLGVSPPHSRVAQPLSDAQMFLTQTQWERGAPMHAWEGLDFWRRYSGVSAQCPPRLGDGGFHQRLFR